MSTTGFSLSPQQRQVWAGQAGGGVALRAVTRVSVRGALDVERLRQALALVVETYEILRTRFDAGVDGAEVVQVVLPAAPVDLGQVDLSRLSSTEGDDRMAALFETWAAGDTRDGASVDAASARDAAGLHVCLARRTAEHHELLLGLPTLCADWIGLGNLVAALAAAYESLSGGQAFDAEAMQATDIAEWQNELLLADESRPGLEFWKERQAAPDTELLLPFQKTAPRAGATTSTEGAPSAGASTTSVPSGRGNVTVCLDAALSADLAALATQLSVSPREVLLAAWATTLYRLAGPREMLLGVGLDGRPYDELVEPLGLLARTLPLPLTLDPEESFGSLVGRLGQDVVAMERWQGCHGAEPSRAPAAFPCHHLPALRVATGGGLQFAVQQQRVTTEACVCSLSCSPRGSAAGPGATPGAAPDGATGTANAPAWQADFCFDEGAFSSNTIQRLAGQWQAVLADGTARPETHLRELDALSAAERQALIVDFNDTDAPYSEGVCAHHWIEAHAAATPDALAVRQGELTLTYGQLEARANQLAHHLMSLGVGPDSMVALCIDRSLEMVVAIVGILKAGGAYVPVDPAYPTERIQFLVNDTDAPVLVTQQRLLGDFADSGAQLVSMDSDADVIGACPTTRPDSGVTPENLVYVIYTSGSTGKPKGVVITHEKLVISNEARVHAFGHTPRSFLLLSSVAFDSSVVGIFWSLCGGGSLLLMPQGVEKDISTIPEYIAEHAASHLLTLPSFYRLILEQAQPEQLGSLTTAIVAGEACPLKLVEHHRRILPAVGMFSEYGATETTVFSSVYDCLPQTEQIAPLGDPILNAQMYILDEQLNPCPMGVPGEVYFGGLALAVCYWKRPELTAERFIENPFGIEVSPRLYKSGDRARFLESGEMEFLGRFDNQVKIRGFRIELEEIEVSLVKHGALKEAAVLALTDLSDEKRLVAYVLVEEDTAAPTVSELRGFLGQSLPEFMVPAVFVFLPEMPRTPNGKVDRKALPEPGAERPELESQFAAPESDAEKTLAGIWAEVLGIDDVGVHDNFFELGGDSILSIQVVSRANQVGIKLTPRMVFENQTVADLLAVAEVTGTPGAQLDQGPVSGPVLLTPVQHWYFGLGLPDPGHWNMPMLLDVARPLDVDALGTALAALERHHDALRTRYARTSGSGWTQRIDPPAPEAVRFPVHVEDLSAVPAAEQAAELDRRAAAHQAALDLDAGPIQRVVLYQRGPSQPPSLLWILHHLVIDGVSWRILLEDLTTALGQLERGEAVTLQPKTTSFQRWSQCLTDYAATPELAAEAGYWFDLATADQAAVPLDHPEGANREAQAAQVRATLDEDTTRALLSEVPKAYNTQINDVLLTALARAFGQWTGRDDLWLVLEGHGRQEVPADVDVSRTVGWFTTDYPVLLTQDRAGYQPGSALQAIKEQLRAVPNQGFAFGLGQHLCSDDGVRRRLGELPWPVVGFNYLGQFDQLFRDDARFRYDERRSGPPLGPDGQRIFVLEVYGMVSNGRLEFDFEFSTGLHERNTIEGLARGFVTALEQLIAHCVSPEAGGFTSSDFADFAWSAGDLSNIAAAIQRSQQDVGTDRPAAP